MSSRRSGLIFMPANIRVSIPNQSGIIGSMTATVPSVPLPNFKEKLDAFFSLFNPTLRLAKQLIDAQTNAQEVVLVVCASGSSRLLHRTGRPAKPPIVHPTPDQLFRVP